MKHLLLLASLLVVLLVGYNIGLRAGQAKGLHTAESYRRLYDQAIMWQNHVIADLPNIQRNIELKEKQ